MREDRHRTSGTITDSEKRAQDPGLDDELSLMSGEALDDDALDELCDAALATIGDLHGKPA